VAKTTDQPLIASHSNVHALTPVSRNLTDKQLAAMRESNGLVGLNFASPCCATTAPRTPTRRSPT
jgi:membrane dipeptidase